MNENWENLDLYHMKNNAAKKKEQLNFSLDIALKVSSSERRVVLVMESVQISPCGFICGCEES